MQPQSLALPARVEQARLPLFGLIFLILALVCSFQRFGQRENEDSPVPPEDSNIYLEMAKVFTGEQAAFSPKWAIGSPHHYNRPLLPFLAGYIGKYALHGNIRAAFSLINILAAAGVGLLLMKNLQTCFPDGPLNWLPSLLFLAGFPQLDWGYHILTDTLGLATTFATVIYASWMLTRPQKATLSPFQFLALFVCSSLGFLARETAWIAVVTTAYLIWSKKRELWTLRSGLILAVLIAGKVPHTMYSHYFHLRGVLLGASISTLIQWRYMLDFVVKTGVAFNFAWILAAFAFFRRDRSTLPIWVPGWTIAAICYMGAGYLANGMNGIGYPLRMSYTLFPLVYFYATDFFKRFSGGKQMALCMGYAACNYAISFLGVVLDGGHGKITVMDIIHKIL